MKISAAKPNNGKVSALPLGDIRMTSNAEKLIKEKGIDPLQFLWRHVAGDHDNLCREDEEKNSIARTRGLRVYSFYDLPSGDKLWIITEGDRSATTILLPEDY